MLGDDDAVNYLTPESKGPSIDGKRNYRFYGSSAKKMRRSNNQSKKNVYNHHHTVHSPPKTPSSENQLNNDDNSTTTITQHQVSQMVTGTSKMNMEMIEKKKSTLKRVMERSNNLEEQINGVQNQVKRDGDGNNNNLWVDSTRSFVASEERKFEKKSFFD